ncbi:MAG: VWA domain-containing protein [Marinilabiliales bacterium]|nr:MAG: VWA domain-containing protein [Marinilabiliales bacterium]
MSFAYPEFLWLLLLIPLMTAWYLIRQRNRYPALRVSGLHWAEKAPVTVRHYIRYFLFAFRMIAAAFLVIVLARPQTHDIWEEIETEGIDIMIALDISSSMLAEDFKPNRMEAARDIATEFIAGRRNDRIGLVIFSGESFTQCPLTSDHAVLVNLLREVEIGMIEDGTAIGMGLATAVNRLRSSDTQSRIIILLTDGVNNRGAIDPLTAANIAATFGIRVYTVGVGSRGPAPFPVRTPRGIQYQSIEADIDEDVLIEIAEITGGSYFRAEDEDALIEIYSEIDELEKSFIDVRHFSSTREEYAVFALLAGVLLLAEWLMRLLVVRSIP